MNSAKSCLGNPYKNEILAALTWQFIVHSKKHKLLQTNTREEKGAAKQGTEWGKARCITSRGKFILLVYVFKQMWIM